MRRTARVAGVSGLHAHALRHACASLALAGGASIVAVRDLLGHGTVLTTSSYLHAAADPRSVTAFLVGAL